MFGLRTFALDPALVSNIVFMEQCLTRKQLEYYSVDGGEVIDLKNTAFGDETIRLRPTMT
jgi:hypothetical protein